MNAETIAKALGGSKKGSNWMVRCPVHHDRNPSLSIRDAADGKVLAGCGKTPVASEFRNLYYAGFKMGGLQIAFQTPNCL